MRSTWSSPSNARSRVGLFLDIFEVARALAFAGGDETKRQGAGFLVDHRIDDDFFERNIGLGFAADAHELLKAAERDTFFSVVDGVSANENRLPNRVCSWTVHNVAQRE